MPRKNNKPLVIVESPTKVKTLKKILGEGYDIEASKGHIRDLPPSSFGLDVDNNFAPTYKIVSGKEAIVKKLISLSKNASRTYLALDPDREGEAIAYHLADVLNLPQDYNLRVSFNEITPKCVREAFQNPTPISMNKVLAQQTRRFLDRIVGYKLSPLLKKKICKGLSAGRVQSVAVKLIVDREKEIKAFKREEYWIITATLSKINEATEFVAELKGSGDNKISIKTSSESEALIDKIKDGKFIVSNISKTEKLESPPPPFITSHLQQQAAIKLKFSVAKTMSIAQQLYEGVELGKEGPVGLITYMRTDSFRIADEAIDSCRDFIKKNYGDNYLLPEKRIYKSKKTAQDAHEAIRPTFIEKTPESIERFLTKDQYKLYKLIWERFVATQMKAACILATNVEIKVGSYLFVAIGKELKFDGYTKITGLKFKKDEQILPSLVKNEELKLIKLSPNQHFTEPSPRYTEASLVKTLEKYGIGRPSTYVPIITTIQQRGYVIQKERKFYPTELGILVTEKLDVFFNNIINISFTAEMEAKLDMIEKFGANWLDILKKFYNTFSVDIKNAEEKMPSEKDIKPEKEEVCENCGKPMVIRYSKFGKFLACSGFPDCKNTKSLPGDLTENSTDEICEKCGSRMVIKMSKGKKFLACSKYPECKNTKPIYRGKQKFKIPEDFDIKCNICGEKMIIKYGKRGPFLACPSYPRCKNTSSIPRDWFNKE